MLPEKNFLLEKFFGEAPLSEEEIFTEYSEYLKLMRELNLNVYDLIGWMDKGGRVHP